MSKTSVYIASFDIGKKNFAFVIQELDKKFLSALGNIPKIERYNKDGTCTPKFKKILDIVHNHGKIVLIRNLDLTKNCNKKAYLDPKVFVNMIDVLDEYKAYWECVEVFLIEQQMNFGKKKRNPMAQKLGQHCYSYFVFNYRDFKKIIDFPSYHKTQILGAPKKFGLITKEYKNGKKRDIKDNRKKWSCRVVGDILQRRGDSESFGVWSDTKKQDDISDCVLMINAFAYMKYIDKCRF
jgi:hypothetical protein